MSQDTRYIFFLNPFDIDMCFFDLVSLNDEEISFPPAFRTMKSVPGKWIKKVVVAKKLKHVIPDAIKEKFYNLESIVSDNSIQYVLVIQSIVACKMSETILEKFKQNHPDIKLYLLLIDSLHAASLHVPYIKRMLDIGIFDKVLTYDRYDANEHGYEWIGFSYYTEKYIEDSSDTNTPIDLYYVGSDKGGRGELVYKIYDLMKSNNFSCKFNIPEPAIFHRKKNFPYQKKWIPYCQVINNVKNSNCILEVLQDGQQTQSLRYLEAVTQNKKLLTNNRHVSELPYYDGRYMKYFEKAEDIDVEWVKKREKIDYGYSKSGGGQLLFEKSDLTSEKDKQSTRVAVAMSTYNGERYLREQLDSILTQTGIDSIDIYVRDDGSTDLTKEILREYADKGNVHVAYGVNVGVGNSFMNCLYSIGNSYDYYAFADQDDIWESNKISEAIKSLRNYGKSLYTSNQIVTDASANPLYLRFSSRPDVTSFSVVVANHVSGCTMVFDRKFYELICEKKRRPSHKILKLRIHDVWMNMVGAITGSVYFDERAFIRYRQHGDNVVGVRNETLWHKSLRRVGRLFDPEKRNARSKFAKEILQKYPEYIPQDSVIRVFAAPTTKENKRQLLKMTNQIRKYSDESAPIIVFKILLNLM